jgi:hypothetical protein
MSQCEVQGDGIVNTGVGVVNDFEWFWFLGHGALV